MGSLGLSVTLYKLFGTAEKTFRDRQLMGNNNLAGIETLSFQPRHSKRGQQKRNRCAYYRLKLRP